MWWIRNIYKIQVRYMYNGFTIPFSSILFLCLLTIRKVMTANKLRGCLKIISEDNQPKMFLSHMIQVQSHFKLHSGKLISCFEKLRIFWAL